MWPQEFPAMFILSEPWMHVSGLSSSKEMMSSRVSVRNNTPFLSRISSLVLFTLSRSAHVTDAPMLAVAQVESDRKQSFTHSFINLSHKPPPHSGELNHALSRGWPNPIQAIPPYVVRTPHLRGAPTTEETSTVNL